jgi:ATP-dependent DNA helicase RecQ
LYFITLSTIAFIDIEASESGKIHDIGCSKSSGESFHKGDVKEFLSFIESCDFLCGHNIVQHDLKLLQKYAGTKIYDTGKCIDTLFLSPLLFPRRPYHKLLKDDKLQTEEKNNPLNDAIKSKELFEDEINSFNNLTDNHKIIFYNLLKAVPGYEGFFRYLNFSSECREETLVELITGELKDKICSSADISHFIRHDAVSLSYAIAVLQTNDRYSITPPWVLRNYPGTERIIFLLKNNPCLPGCNYCQSAFDPVTALKDFFQFDQFRLFGNEPLQENAIRAAVNNKSLLTIFPTGGGKSLTFQLPALISGRNSNALTVIISPLQSLMKDQVDNLEKKGITEAVTINGSLDPIERCESINRVEEGKASILYISPESLRSITVERLLLKRKIARFVIDEAHCFSAWGQDFRVDYLYIGKFIRTLQEKKMMQEPIPVSCYTATAKPKVIEDIVSYFKEELKIELEIFKASTGRTNLHYNVYRNEKEEDKYNQLRDIISSKDCPTIVYVSRTRRAYQLAERLTQDGYEARAYHGKMDKEDKKASQDSFMAGEVDIIVATSAFGMGVDKADVGAVIHYDISDSLENYVQEAGRAGRDESINAECFILFNEEDLDKHFVLLNQTKIGIKEINQIWSAIKDLSRTRNRFSNSALEIARKAGWDDSVMEIETRVVTAIAALEDAGYLSRGQNMPRVYADSITSRTAQEAINKINTSEKIEEELKATAIRVIRKLFSSKSKRLSTDEQAESRVDYISDQLGIYKEKVIRVIELLREENILAQAKDLTAFIKRGERVNRSLNIVETFRTVENFIFSKIADEPDAYSLKEINEELINEGLQNSTVARLKTIFNFWAIQSWIKKKPGDYNGNYIQLELKIEKPSLKDKLEKRHWLARTIVEILFEKSEENNELVEQEDVLVEFSVQELKEFTLKRQGLYHFSVSSEEIEDALFYLSRIEAIKIEGGFLVVYNKLSFERLEKNNRVKYKEIDFTRLGNFYKQKVQQIHIVGEYAKKMLRDYDEALRFVDDYFNLNYSSFINKYFPGNLRGEIDRTLTPEKFQRLFGELSPSQLSIIKDSETKHMVVTAGPGSGKTRILVHKLASLLLAEDVKHEQLLMLTFSRAAATEFKKRLLGLIGNAAHYVEIKTFHSYFFDILGRVGSLEQTSDIVKQATEKIASKEVEMSRITKTVLVIDEAQDINAEEFNLIRTLMIANENMRVILVGDDDQNIFEFRGSSSVFMQQLMRDHEAKKYELIENYRSKSNLVNFTSRWAEKIRNRLKIHAGIAVQLENGEISITQYSSPHLMEPLSKAIALAELKGTTCVLVRTNEEAASLAGFLCHLHIPVKLIQTNEGFPLSKLDEIKYFTDEVISDSYSSLITEDEWKEGKRMLSIQFRESTNLETALSIISQFELVNAKRKYRTDWNNFLAESRMEDFSGEAGETIFISTIHKAKGKEFDNVYLLLNYFRPDSDEKKRLLYVSMTRARSILRIHCNESYFRDIMDDTVNYDYDNVIYSEPSELSIFLNHKLVNLSYFEYVQGRIENLRAGSALNLLPDGLANMEGKQVVKYSARFKEELDGYKANGYNVDEARVNVVVWWWSEKEKREVKVLLPKLVIKNGKIN